MLSADLYGSEVNDLKKVKCAIESALQIRFELHDSLYRGGDYYKCGSARPEHFILQRNVDLEDGTPAESAFAAYPVILFIEETERSAAIQQLLMGSGSLLSLLRHQDLSF